MRVGGGGGARRGTRLRLDVALSARPVTPDSGEWRVGVAGSLDGHDGHDPRERVR